MYDPPTDARSNDEWSLMTKRGLAFATAFACVLTAYFVVATAVLADRATTAADHAVVDLLGVFLGATGLMALGLLVTLGRLEDEEVRDERSSKAE